MAFRSHVWAIDGALRECYCDSSYNNYASFTSRILGSLATVIKMPMSDGFSFQDIAVEDAVFVAVMGITGSGKSNFVKLATGSDKEIVGNNLTSCIIESLCFMQ